MILTERVHFVPIRVKEPYSYPYAILVEEDGNIVNLLRKFFSVIGTGLAGISLRVSGSVENSGFGASAKTETWDKIMM